MKPLPHSASNSARGASPLALRPRTCPDRSAFLMPTRTFTSMSWVALDVAPVRECGRGRGMIFVLASLRAITASAAPMMAVERAVAAEIDERITDPFTKRVAGVNHVRVREVHDRIAVGVRRVQRE